MKHDLNKLSEIALLLNFILAKAFIEKGLESKLGTSLSVISESLYIRRKKTHTILRQIEKAFEEIHNHQFIMYKYEVMISSNPEKTMLDISIVNHDVINAKSIKEMLKGNARILVGLGYEVTLPVC